MAESFSHEEMKEFIYNFDTIFEKYRIQKENTQNYIFAMDYEHKHRPTNLKKHKYSDMIDMTLIVYNSLSRAHEYSAIYKRVLDTFLIDFVGIQGLPSLYDEKYMNFEWNMHSNLDFKNHSNLYYRDHFIHEIRDMYMSLRLLDDEYISYNVNEALNNTPVSKVCQYYTHQKDCWLDSNHAELAKVVGVVSNNADDEKLSDYFFRYVTKASTIIACLFHDIGYPIAHYISIKDRLISFIPPIYSIMGDNNFDFNYIYSLLSESVLFQFVGKDEIQKRFLQNDHGTLSAILLGVYFYKTGIIHSLPIEQQTAVELAILSIYNHTLDFLCVDKEADTEYYSMRFTLSPLSYILRLSDDLQEWDREYFEIKPMPSLQFCPDCKTPIIRTGITASKYLEHNQYDFLSSEALSRCDIVFNKINYYNYSCSCKNDFLVKKDDFTRRKLVNIKVCDEVIIDFDRTNKAMNVNVIYNPYKMLRLCQFHSSFMSYRSKELSKVKRYVHGQSFMKDFCGYKYIHISHNISGNPILLKAFIIQDFLNQLSKQTDPAHKCIYTNDSVLATIRKIYISLYSTLIGFSSNSEKNNIDELISNMIKSLAEKIVEMCYSIECAAFSEPIKAAFRNCQKYLWLCMYKLLQEDPINNTLTSLFEDIIRDKFADILAKSDCRSFLCKDAIEQIKQISNSDFFAPLSDPHSEDPNAPKEYLKESKELYFKLQHYCDSDNPENSYRASNYDINYFVDLYLFEKLDCITEILKKQDKLFPN